MGPNPKETTDLVTFAKEIVNRKLHILCSIKISVYCALCNMFCTILLFETM